MNWFLLILAAAAPLAAQSPQSCSYTVTPTSIIVPPNGGSGTISVDTQASCTWGFATNNTWITLSSPTAFSGQVNGSGILNYTATATTLPTSQQGAIIVSGPNPGIVIPVTQGATS